jgi:site-specific DNA-methyltransferase (adenine-specific)
MIDDNVQLYLGDCLTIMRSFADNSVDCVICDPPYGINYDLQQNKQNESGRVSNRGKWKHYEYTAWDSKIPDKQYFDEIIRISKRQIIWGGNYFSLPSHSKWLIWNKIQRGYMTDGEMAWTNLDGSIKIFARRCLYK